MIEWEGIIDGTNKGIAVGQINFENNSISGNLKISETNGLNYSATLTGILDGQRMRCTLTDFEPAIEGLPSSGSLEGNLSQDGKELTGTWETNTSTHGTFHLYYMKPAQQPIQPTIVPPPQPGSFVAKTVNLPPCRLDVNGLVGLLTIAIRGTKVVHPSFSIVHDGKTLIKNSAQEFASDQTLPSTIYDMTITMNELTENSGYQMVVINLKRWEANSLFVYGIDSTWVEGKCAEVDSFLKDFQTRIGKIYRQYGLWINSIIFLGMLAVLPSIPSIGRRSLFIFLVTLLLMALLAIHKSVVPNTKIYLKNAPPTFWRGWEDAVVSALATVIGTSVLVFLSKLFIEGWVPFTEWLFSSTR